MQDNKKFHKRTITTLVVDKPGVLARIASMFRRRGFNIVSLAVGHSEYPGFSRMTFVVEGQLNVISFVAAQLDKLVDIVDVQDVTDKNFVWRELALIKVKAESHVRGEILELSQIFRANIVDIGIDSLIMEITGGRSKIDSLVELLRSRDYLITVMRTGRIAVLRSPLYSGGAEGEFVKNYGTLQSEVMNYGSGSV